MACAFRQAHLTWTPLLTSVLTRSAIAYCAPATASPYPGTCSSDKHEFLFSWSQQAACSCRRLKHQPLHTRPVQWGSLAPAFALWSLHVSTPERRLVHLQPSSSPPKPPVPIRTQV